MTSDNFKARRRRRLKGQPLQVRHKQDWGRGFIFYYPRVLYCTDQMLAVMVPSQYQDSLSKTVRPRAPCGARGMGQQFNNLQLSKYRTEFESLVKKWVRIDFKSNQFQVQVFKKLCIFSISLWKLLYPTKHIKQL